MYIIDGIAYAGEIKPVVRVCGVKVLDDFKLRIRFTNGEIRLFDFKPLLKEPAFKRLNDENEFKEVYIDYGTVVWDDGNIDIAPEYLYENSIPTGKGV